MNGISSGCSQITWPIATKTARIWGSGKEHRTIGFLPRDRGASFLLHGSVACITVTTELPSGLSTSSNCILIHTAVSNGSRRINSARRNQSVRGRTVVSILFAKLTTLPIPCTHRVLAKHTGEREADVIVVPGVFGKSRNDNHMDSGPDGSPSVWCLPPRTCRQNPALDNIQIATRRTMLCRFVATRPTEPVPLEQSAIFSDAPRTFPLALDGYTFERISRRRYRRPWLPNVDASFACL